VQVGQSHTSSSVSLSPSSSVPSSSLPLSSPTLPPSWLNAPRDASAASYALRAAASAASASESASSADEPRATGTRDTITRPHAHGAASAACDDAAALPPPPLRGGSNSGASRTMKSASIARQCVIAYRSRSAQSSTEAYGGRSSAPAQVWLVGSRDDGASGAGAPKCCSAGCTMSAAAPCGDAPAASVADGRRRPHPVANASSADSSAGVNVARACQNCSAASAERFPASTVAARS
jgi:hypothetical protein